MRKSKRQIVFEKYNGKCAYCGCELPKIWHIDHLLPVVRNPKTGEKEFPERDKIENMMPSCPSCNINKHSDSLERFRDLISGFINSLNRDSTQYKIAKRYGLISENKIEVKFYFETLHQPHMVECSNCGDKVEMISSGEFCPHCFC